jgi:hypothetical protein
MLTNHLHEPWTWTEFLDKRPKRRNIDMRLAPGTLEVCIGQFTSDRRWILERQNWGGVLIALVWLRIGTSGKFL